MQKTPPTTNRRFVYRRFDVGNDGFEMTYDEEQALLGADPEPTSWNTNDLLVIYHGEITKIWSPRAETDTLFTLLHHHPRVSHLLHYTRGLLIRECNYEEQMSWSYLRAEHRIVFFDHTKPGMRYEVDWTPPPQRP